jgi:PAS domain S-box-containing protein
MVVRRSEGGAGTSPRTAWPVPTGLDYRRLRTLRNLAIFGIAYFFAYKYGMNLSKQIGAPFWFPDPVLLCALLLSPPGMWWIFIAATLPIRLFAVATPLPAWFLLAAFVNDSLKGLIAASLTRRALRGKEIRFDALHDLWVYLAAAVLLAPALSSVAGAVTWVVMGRAFWPAWRQWFLGDAIANLVCVPLFLYLARDWRKLIAARPARYAEGLVLFAALPLSAYLAYQHGMGNAGLVDPFGYIPLPFLVWAAVRFGPAGASGALSVISILCVAAASASQPGISPPGSMDSTLSIQLFIAVLAIPILSLSVLVEQQRKTEESLRESEERFRNMADSAPVMIWISAADGLATFFNKVWLDFTGRTLEEERGNGWTKNVDPNDLAGYWTSYWAAFYQCRHSHMEYRLRRADGEYRWILSSGAPRFTPGGVFAGYIVSAVDITDLKRSQDEAFARQKLESLGVLTAGIAHDFNNLLGSILALAECVETELAPGTPAREEVQKIETVAMRASEIVREMMIYSGQDKASLAPVDVSQLVEDMLELLKVSISKHAALQTDLQKSLPPVLGSAPQIRQIVMNLIINASEAIGEKDGVIRIGTSRIAGDRGYVRLEVSDTGCGMTQAAQAKIFDPFFSTKFAGRGMGLAVVQGTVRAHDGAIQLVSSPGQGTTFEIFLPCAGEPAQSGPAAVSSHSSVELPPASGTVLVVEDEAVLRAAVSALLRKKGFSVIEANDGTAAVDLIHARKDEIDMMLLDVTLPGLSSREVLEQARHLRPHLKVVITSAYSRDAVEASFAGLQVERFIRKPFRLDDLIGVLADDVSA